MGVGKEDVEVTVLVGDIGEDGEILLAVVEVLELELEVEITVEELVVVAAQLTS